MRVTLILMLALVMSACTSTSDSDVSISATSSTTTTTGTTTVTEALNIPPQIADFDMDLVTVGDRLLLLSIADSPGLRAQGLQGVTDLGDLDGMLFYWRHAAHGDFWMKDTLIPLDIAWFLADGSYAGRASMEPCTADPCERYSPGQGLDYRFAIEADPGDLDWVTEDMSISYSD